MEGHQGDCKRKSTNRNKCYFTGCSRTKAKFPELHFFYFPINRPEICDKWVNNCANEALESIDRSGLKWKVVCEKHFTQESFTSFMKTKLTKEAVPTIFVDDEEVGDVDMRCSSPIAGPSTVETIENNSFHRITPTSSTPSIITPKSKKALFSNTPSPIRTPVYKKLKRVKDRKATPSKVITPGKKKLLNKLKQTISLKNKYRQSLKRLSSKKQEGVISKTSLILGMKAYLPPAVFEFFQMQLNHCGKKMSWTAEEKKQILKWRYKSPSLYNQMRHDGFALPAPRTISRWLEVVNMKTGICENIMKQIAMKVECMSEVEKKTVVLLDEMVIKKSLEYNSKMDAVEGVLDLGEGGRKSTPGSNILLVMARGLILRWKMPVAFYVTNKNVTAANIKDIIPNCVDALQLAGLDVKAVVCDQGSINRKVGNNLGVSSSNRKFKNGGKDVYLIYDFPHIVKCIRNNLMKRDKEGNFVGQISTSCGTADWRYVVEFYNIDRFSSSAVRATKLTEKHICPNQFEKMSVKLATQIFSHTVASGMQTAIETKQLPIEAKETVTFISKMNDIIDAMNSTSKLHPNPNKCALAESEDPLLKQSVNTIESGIIWAKTWRMAKDSRPPSFFGLVHTMSATLELWRDLKAEGISYLMTNRLCQDPLENEFSISRSKGGYNNNPSARMFRLNLQHRIQSALMIPPAGTNCQPDDDQLLTTVTGETSCLSDTNNQSGLSASTDDITETTAEGDGLVVESESDDEWAIDDPNVSQVDSVSLEGCSIRYFAGYAARCCMKKFLCEDCAKELLKQTTDSRPDELLITNREYKERPDTSGYLTYPSDSTTRAAKVILTIFNRLFTKNIQIVGLKKKILLKCKQWLYKVERDWVKAGSPCSTHRNFFIDKMVTAMLKRKCQEISKDLRQPSGGKHGGFWQKVQKLKNK